MADIKIKIITIDKDGKALDSVEAPVAKVKPALTPEEVERLIKQKQKRRGPVQAAVR